MPGVLGKVRACAPKGKITPTARSFAHLFRLFMALVVKPVCRSLLALLILAPVFAAYATTYTYDAAGRLKSATNSTGQTAGYVYDSRGNLTSITLTGSTQLAIVSFAPNNGPPGATVTINGSGFDSSTSGDSVSFNGSPASVLSASPTQLIVQVPQNATTGPITVTVASVIATGADIFSVTTVGDPPLISGFSPAIATPGTTVTLAGQNLDPIAGETTLTVDGVFVPITSLDDLSITFQVPSWAGSGQITVGTPFGTATTTAPMIVVPVGTVPSTVTVNPPLVSGAVAEATTFSTSITNAVFLFPGTVGEYASLQVSAFSDTSQSVQYSVYSPLGIAIASGTLSASSPSVQLPQLNETGSYSVLLKHSTGALQVSLQFEANPTIVTNGVSLGVTSPIPGGSKRFTFTAIAGENLGLGISNLSIANKGTYYGVTYITIRAPNGSNWVGNGNSSCQQPQCSFNLWNAPQSGTYTVTVAADGPNATFSLMATLMDSLIVTLPATNTPTTMSLPRFGENGMYTFSGMAGQQVALQFAIPSGNTGVSIQANNPDGSILVGGVGIISTNTYNLTLSQTGTYIVYVWLSNGGVPSNIVTTLAVDAAPVPVSIAGNAATVSNQLGGQTSYFTFTATAGENLGLGINNLSIANKGSYYGVTNITIRKPDGTVWVSNTSCQQPQCNFNLWNAPQTGTYTVAVAADGPNATFSLTATLSDSVITSLPATDTPTTMSLPRFGENGMYTFSGMAGQQVALQFAIPSGNTGVSIQANNPNGSILIGGVGITSTNTYNLTLSQTGTYIVYAWLGNGGVPSNIITTLAVDAPPVPVSTGGGAATVMNQLGGQTSYFTFSATAGENLGLGINNLSIANKGSYYGVTNITIRKPDGTVWVSNTSCQQPQCNFNLWNAPQTGTYTVAVAADGPNATFSLTATLSDSVITTLPATDTPTTMSLPRFGQNGMYTFSGTAGQQVALQFAIPSGNTSVSIQANNPDGSILIGGVGITSTNTYNLTLSQTGTYIVYAWLGNGGVPSNIVTTLAVDAAPVPVSTGGGTATVVNQLGGQTSYFTFSATAGENLGLGISNLSIANKGTYYGATYITIRKPDGTTWVSNSSCQQPQCSFNLWNAPQTGTYMVAVVADGPSATFSLTATLSDSVITGLPATNTPTTMSLSRFGQNGMYTFSGTAGQQVALQFAVQPGGNSSIGIVAYNPDGSTLIGSVWVGTSIYNKTLTQTGTYTIQVWLNGGVPGGLTATLH